MPMIVTATVAAPATLRRRNPIWSSLLLIGRDARTCSAGISVEQVVRRRPRVPGNFSRGHDSSIIDGRAIVVTYEADGPCRRGRLSSRTASGRAGVRGSGQAGRLRVLRYSRRAIREWGDRQGGGRRRLS